MNPKINYPAVGVFVLSLMIAIILAIIWLSAGFSFKKNEMYAVYLNESVSGLSIDAAVEFNGVGVGNVKRIEIDRQNPRLVEILLSIDAETPITEGTVATLNSRGITGFTYVELKDKGNDLRPLHAQPGQRYPVIKTSPSLFMRLDMTLTHLSKNLRIVSESIQSVLDQQNQQAIKNILSHLEEVSATLANNSKHMQRILENTAKASETLEPILSSGKNAIQNLEQQTLPQAYRLMSMMEEVMRDLSQFSADLKQNPSILIRGNTLKPLGPGETHAY